MADLNKTFVPNPSDAISDDRTVFKGKVFRITVLSESLLRLEYDEAGQFEDRPTEFAQFRNFPRPQFDAQETSFSLIITTKYFRLTYLKEKPFIGTFFSQDSNLKVELLGTDKTWYYGHEEVRNYGGFVNNLETKEPYITHTEKMMALKDTTKQKANEKKAITQKGLYSSDGFVSIDDSKSLLIDEQGYLIKDERERIDTYLFMYKKDFGVCLKDYFTLTGYPPMIPRYALGIWWNKTKPYNYKDIQQLVSDFNKYEIPMSVLLLGDSWHIKDPNNKDLFKSGFTFDPEKFSSAQELTTYLHDRGIRLGINIDPCEGIHTHEKNYDLFAENMGLKDKQTIPFNVFDKNLIGNYLELLITPLFNSGVDFFWIDYYTNDRKRLNALNYYQYNDFKKSVANRGMLLTRINDIAPHKYPVHYSGESMVSWESLDKIPAYNELGSNLGLSWWSHDIGGYKFGVEDRELYTRYIQLGVFSPIFRLASDEGHYYKRKPWTWDVNTYNIVRDYCKLRHRFISYIYSEGYKYHKSGMPLIRPLYYILPEVYYEKEFKNEYLFGSELLIAPITKPSDSIMQRSVERIKLPEGTWYDFKTGKKFNGGKVYYMFFKQEDYPVFAKDGSIICLADLEENLNVTRSPETLEVHVFPGKSNTYNLYEDDGMSRLYEKGYYIVTSFDYNYLENNYTLIIRPIEGKSKIIPDARNYRIRFRNTRQPRDVSVLLQNTELKFDAYEEDNDFVINIEKVDTTKQITVFCKGQNIEIDSKRIINDDIDSIINDLQITTALKTRIAQIMFDNLDISKKRIKLKKLHKNGLEKTYINMFLKLLDYIKEF